MTEPTESDKRYPSVLAPSKAVATARKLPGFEAVLQKVILHASITSPGNFLAQVYLAGLWHGAETMRQLETKP